MKTTIFLIGILLLVLGSNVSSKQVTAEKSALNQATVKVLCNPDLSDLSKSLASEYNKLNRPEKIEVRSTGFSGSALNEGENLCLVSNLSVIPGKEASGQKLVIGHSVIVPVINPENPYYKELLKNGINQKQFVQIFKKQDKQNWGTLVKAINSEPVHIYVVKDEILLSGLTKFLAVSQTQFQAITFGSTQEVLSAIENDRYAIGFCNLVNIQHIDNNALTGKLKILPIDKNGNGTIDYMEDIYSDMNAFQRGIWIGKYPKALVSNVFAVSSSLPASENETAFLKWILTDGQQFMNENGFCDLISSESQSQLDKLNVVSVDITSAKEPSNAGLVLLIVTGILILGLITGAIISNVRKQKNIIPDFNDSHPGFSENEVVLPKGLYFDKTHTWAFMEKDGMISIGLDDFIHHITGPISRIEMKKPGDKIKKGELLFSIIQSGKQLNIFSPLSGTIKKQNESLLTESSLLSLSPYSQGWVYMVEPNNWLNEVQLFDLSEKYRKWLNAEFLRMKDFMAAILKPENQELSLVLQDGGALKEGVLSDFGPEVWEDFQTNFLDTFR